MTIYSGYFVHALMFTFLNGTQLVCGNTKNNFISQINTISLTNRIISGFNLYAASWIDSFQFELTNSLIGTVTMTPRWGGFGGSLVILNALNLEPESLYFEITQFTGIFDDQNLRQLKVGYNYKLCVNKTSN